MRKTMSNDWPKFEREMTYEYIERRFTTENLFRSERIVNRVLYGTDYNPRDMELRRPVESLACKFA